MGRESIRRRRETASLATHLIPALHHGNVELLPACFFSRSSFSGWLNYLSAQRSWASSFNHSHAWSPDAKEEDLKTILVSSYSTLLKRGVNSGICFGEDDSQFSGQRNAGAVGGRDGYQGHQVVGHLFPNPNNFRKLGKPGRASSHGAARLDLDDKMHCTDQARTLGVPPALWSGPVS
ncbi:hypothetical protein E2P81_ATG07875 [Venturia nashicola]|nr:hypothetical protein E2P81_ATG07875 [Venturia nashicola]